MYRAGSSIDLHGGQLFTGNARSGSERCTVNAIRSGGHVATKLNRSHLLTARHSYILPVLGRSEIDMQKSGAQAVTVEDSMSMIHASRGVLKPAGVMLKSECAVVAGIAQATLPRAW